MVTLENLKDSLNLMTGMLRLNKFKLTVAATLIIGGCLLMWCCEGQLRPFGRLATLNTDRLNDDASADYRG